MNLLSLLLGVSTFMLFARLKRARDAEENTHPEEKETLESAPIVSENQPLSEGHLMTTAEAKTKWRDWCLSQVGYREALDGSNKYADGVWDIKLYGFNAKNVPWCDVFSDYSYIACFGYDAATKMTYQTPAGYAACKLSADAYKRNGAFYSEPEVGDQVFFYYGGDINHVGNVVAVNGEEIQCVEGNYSDSVSLTKYNTRNQWLIAGYGRPNWKAVAEGCDDDSCDIDIKPTICDQEMWAALAEKMPDIQHGSLGYAVIALQAMLNFLGADLEMDGDCGILTEKVINDFKEDKL